MAELKEKGHQLVYVGDVVGTGSSRKSATNSVLWYMGDDIPDLECMKAVGIPVCPSDAASEVIEASRYVSEFAGGHGCVRDIIEQVLRARDDWARDSRGMHSSNIAASR